MVSPKSPRRVASRTPESVCTIVSPHQTLYFPSKIRIRSTLALRITDMRVCLVMPFQFLARYADFASWKASQLLRARTSLTWLLHTLSPIVAAEAVAEAEDAAELAAAAAVSAPAAEAADAAAAALLAAADAAVAAVAAVGVPV